MKLLAIAIVTLLFPLTAVAVTGNTEIVCSYSVKAADGRFQIVPSNSLKVLQQISEAKAFALPSDAPKDIAALMCARTSPIPVLHDALVL
ncbi:MAG TPA: hypothetical protein VIY48_09855, partial [Candidatus Paceibacterota bacterium]